MKQLSLVTTLFVFSSIAGCVAADDDYDQQLLAQYRSALPSQAQLTAPTPVASTQSALGDPAFYPTTSWPIVVGINGSVIGLVGLLDLITATPPTVYNSDTKEFVWGPYPAEFGYTAAYIKDVGQDEDFRYHFAFLRGTSNDMATLTPVVWGGSSPDESNNDYGVGLALWDFTASRDFEEAHNPNFEPDNHPVGRYATLFGKGEDENDADAELTVVLAAFREFVPANSTADAVDLDYLYGRHDSDNAVVDFIDYEAALDISEPADGIAENIGVRMAFLNGGTGRAEADAVGGSLPEGHSYQVTECWDTSLNETYLLGQHMNGESMIDEWEAGQAADCGLFATNLDQLNVPSLQDIDSALLSAFFDFAEHGIPE